MKIKFKDHRQDCKINMNYHLQPGTPKSYENQNHVILYFDEITICSKQRTSNFNW